MLPNPGVSILPSYGEKPLYVKLPILSEFMENSTKFMKNSGLTKWTQNLRKEDRNRFGLGVGWGTRLTTDRI